MYHRELIASMNNPHAAEAWRTACALNEECAVLGRRISELSNSNSELREGRLRLKVWLDDVQHALGEARSAQRKTAELCAQAVDAGHYAGIALLREQARSKITRRNALNYGLGLLVVLSAIVIGIVAGGLMVL